MKKRILIVVLILTLVPAFTFAIEELEFGLTPQGGYTLFFGRVGELVGPDISYGVDVQYGILHWIAIDLDFLYSEHQQSDSADIGQAQLNHLQTSIGPRFSYNNPYAIPYATLSFGGNFFHWENRTAEKSDSNDGQGMTGYALLGVDFVLADNVTLGLAGKLAMTRTDFEFYTKKDRDERIEAYGLISTLVRLSIVF